jgi:YD repeat-containing protein
LRPYGYDAAGNLTSKTDRKNQTIQYVYDALNRLTNKGYPDSTGVDYIRQAPYGSLRIAAVDPRVPTA